MFSLIIGVSIYKVKSELNMSNEALYLVHPCSGILSSGLLKKQSWDAYSE